MLEAKAVADAFLSELRGEPCAAFDWSARETRTYWRFYWNTVAAIEGKSPALKGVAAVAVHKAIGEASLDPKLLPRDCVNKVFPSPPAGPVTSVDEARHVAQAWLDATMEAWSSITRHRELPRTWAFLWTTDEFLRTRNPSHSLVGAGPLMVLKATGELFLLGSALPFEELCADFERTTARRS